MPDVPPGAAMGSAPRNNPHNQKAKLDSSLIYQALGSNELDNPAATNCPLCRIPMRNAARLIAFRDDAGSPFAFELCNRCSTRLDRLPVRLAHRQLEIAVSHLARSPERYYLKFFESDIEARIFVQLEAERKRQSNRPELAHG